MLKITTILFLIINNLLIAEVFFVYNVETKNFPSMTANFLILDDLGYPINDVFNGDFKVIDNNKDVSQSVSVNCYEETNIIPQRIVLAIDISSSMSILDSNGQSIWSWVKEGVTNFLNAIRFENDIEVGIIIFNHEVYKLCDFSNQKNKLINSLDEIFINGGTDYDKAFLNPQNGVLSLFQNIDDYYKKICVFLTDGYPNNTPNTIEVIEQMLSNHVQVYSITVNSPMNYSLKEISEQTGGKSYEIHDQPTLHNLYDLIATYTNTNQICLINWISDVDCNFLSDERIVDITYLPSKSRRYFYYKTPDVKIARLIPNVQNINLQNIELGKDTTIAIRLTAQNSTFKIDSILVKNTDNFSILDTLIYPISIKKDSSFEFKIKFINKRYNYVQDDNIFIISDPCETNINILTGNYTLNLLSPNGGEIYSVCDTVPILWNKCNADDKIDIFYRKNFEDYWRIITSSVNNFSYNWHIKKDSLLFDDTEIELKINLSKNIQQIWDKHLGNEFDQFLTDFTFSPHKNFLYLTGNFEGVFNCGKELISNGDLDGFIVKYDTYGNYLTSAQIGSDGKDSLSAIYYDINDNVIYVTGYCSKNLKYNETPIINQIQNKNSYHMFLLKLTPELELIDYMIDPKEINSQIEFKIFDINIYRQHIFLYGKFLGRINIFDELHIADTVWTDFEATFDKDFNLVFFKLISIPDSLKNKSFFTDYNKISYNLINFTDTLEIYDTKFIPKGKNDILILKSIVNERFEDKTDSIFKIIKPNFHKNIDTMNLGKVIPGEQVEISFKNIIDNIDIIPLNINSIKIFGPDSNYFYCIDSNKTIIDVNDKLGLTIGCKTDDFRKYKALMEINFECVGSVYFTLLADAECKTECIDSIFVASVPTYFKAEKTFNNVFTNNNNIPIKIEPIIINDSLNEFRLLNDIPIILKPYEKTDITISFIPKSNGFKNAVIEWHPDFNCYQNITKICGIGLEMNISTPSVTWNTRRVKSINDTVIYLHNYNNFSIKIDSLKIEYNDIFYIKNNVVGLEIKPYDSIGIILSFVPQSEQIYSSSISVFINANEVPYFIRLHGKGALPKINVFHNCNKEILVNKTTNIDVIIENISLDMPITIYKLELISNNSPFKILEHINNPILPNSKQTISLEFYPQRSGENIDTLIIISDACPYKNPLPLDTMYYVINCNAYNLNFNNQITLDTMYTCHSYDQHLTIENNSQNTDLIIYNYFIDKPPNVSIEILNPIPITIKSGKKSDILILFKSDKEGSSRSTIKFYTNWDTIISCDLLAFIKKYEIIPQSYNYNFDIGIDTLISFDINVPDFSESFSEDIDIYLTHWNNSIIYNIERINSNLSNWFWEVINFRNNYLHLKGHGRIDFIKNIGFLNLPLSTFFADSIVFITLNYGLDECIIDSNIVIKISLNDICFSKGRRLVFSDKLDIANLSPNPFNEEILLTLNLPSDIEFSIKINDILGIMKYYENKNTYFNNYFKEKINLKDLQPGLYFLIIETENEIISKKIIKLNE